MALQNGSSNGTVTQNSDDISNAAVHMTVVDETENMVNDRRPSLTSRDSLDNEDDGKDNPAFEADVEAAHEKPKNGKSAEDNPKEPSANGANKENVEMVPLNPAPQQNKKANAAPVNGSSGKNKDQTKVALDTMYSDYFRPVNTRRKLLRGEKLYVTRDQRAHSRSWKWFAFWGGVFTFIAAALLTGILAATGIIMSKSEPTSFASSNSLMGNFSSNDTLFDLGNEEMNDTDASVTEHQLDVTSHFDVQHPNHDQKAETDPVSLDIGTTEQTHLTVSDFGNSLDENGWTSSHENPTPHGMITWFANDNITTGATVSTTTFLHPATSTDSITSDVDEVEESTPERGRSLEEEATLFPAINETLLPVSNETLFPAVNETLFPAVNETHFPAVNETFFPAINETLFPAVDETLFPAVNETLFPAVNETLFSDINETILMNEHSVSSNGSKTFPENQFTSETSTEFRDNDNSDVLHAANSTSNLGNDAFTENFTTLPPFTTLPAENDFILQITGNGKPKSLFLPDDVENDTAIDEGKETEFSAAANVTTALPPASTEEFIYTVDDTIHLEEATSTLEDSFINDQENSTSEWLPDDAEFERTTESVDEELINSTDSAGMLSTSNTEDTTVFEDEIIDEHATNSSEITESEVNANGTEIPATILEGDVNAGKALVVTAVPLTNVNDTLSSSNEANINTESVTLQSNSTATNAPELLVSPDESSESAIVSKESSEPTVVPEESTTTS